MIYTNSISGWDSVCQGWECRAVDLEDDASAISQAL